MFLLRKRKPRNVPVRFTVDARAFTSREDCHRSMQKVFAGQEYYGTNLDALHDVLTSLRTPAEITVIGLGTAAEKLGDYADGLRRVFTDSAAENPNLTVRFTEEA